MKIEQHEVVRMAREAGLGIELAVSGSLPLERFAALVAEATKAKYEKRFDEVFGELIEKVKDGMSVESAIRSMK